MSGAAKPVAHPSFEHLAPDLSGRRTPMAAATGASAIDVVPHAVVAPQPAPHRWWSFAVRSRRRKAPAPRLVVAPPSSLELACREPERRGQHER